MKLSSVLKNSSYEDLFIDKVVYRRGGETVSVKLVAEKDLSDEDFIRIRSALEELVGCPVDLAVQSDRKPLPPAKPSYYEEPVIIRREAKVPTVPVVEREEGFQIGRKFSKADEGRFVSLDQVQNTGDDIVTKGILYQVNAIETKTGLLIISFNLENAEGGALSCKIFVRDKDKPVAREKLRDGQAVLVKGRIGFDSYANKDMLTVVSIGEARMEESRDEAPVKRVEFAVHTQMSNMEGLIDPKALKKRLKDWGHTAVGITDFASVQAFPVVYDALKGTDIKLILGYEAKILSDEHKILTNPYRLDLGEREGAYTVFDIETTGFSRFNDRIIEIGAVRYEEGNIVGEFSEFVYPERSLPEKIIELTGITDAMLQNAEKIDQVLPEFLKFSENSILVAHNADFDVGFIVENAKRLGIDFCPVYLDTLGLARCLQPDYKNHKLDTLTKNLGISLVNHHRASDDARATGSVFLKLMEKWAEEGLPLEEINRTPSNYPPSHFSAHRTLIYVDRQQGLKNLYRLVSMANLEYFYRSPGIPAKALEENREGLLVMTGFVGSDLFEAVSRRLPKARLLELADRYDLICVQPPAYWEKAEQSELVADEAHYRDLVERIIRLADELDKPCLAINSPFYLEKGEKLARNILVNYQRNIEFEEKERYRFLNTEEMLKAFSWLGKELAYRLVVTATNELADRIEKVLPIPEGTFTPELENADRDLRQMTFDRARSIYGDPLPELVEKRLTRELDSIISNGYASLYVIAQKLVDQSNRDGYLVGSRGSVGSSFAATMAGITEVNPLVPHYVCPSCKHSEFITDGSVGAGFDLPYKECPSCGHKMNRDGHDIPFEVFLGFHGDKEPDIDLNFAGSYMSTIHRFTEELFGKGKVFRAGTISGVQSLTAYGLIKKYLEQEYNPEEDARINDARISSLQRMMEGTRRTTGQHAGGLMIVPQHMDILDFCPVQYPADDSSSEVVTTHFSYKNLSGRMLKLDELGHTSPTIIRQLQEMTGIDPLTIDFDDEETIQIFSDCSSLKAQEPYSNENDGSLGVPEFGTGFVRGMLRETKPTSFAELTRISGLSHGTDVWLNNAQDLIRDGVTTLSKAICTRDDIMTYLISMGMDKLDSFKTMEAVRKGRGIPDGMEEKMRDHQVPDWYIESCKKIQYMFPKAHAAAYVMMSYRIAWFKVHSPAAFYATYYSQRLSDFSSAYLFQNLGQVQDFMKEMKADSGDKPVDDKKWTLLEVIEEMYARGYRFAPVSLYDSQAASFTITDEFTVLPPLAALDDVSEAAAQLIVQEREVEFISRQDFKNRTKANRSAMTSMEDYGLLDSLPASNQMSFLPGF